MPASIITTDDLREFKEELLYEIKELLKAQAPQNFKKYLKSKEVERLLRISHGTLQQLRVNGFLRYSKLGGTIYYDGDQLQQLMDEQFNRKKH
jgi:hypothetical protein